MLVLKRKSGEAITLKTRDGLITITVDHSNKGVALLFEAPDTVKIKRAENHPNDLD